MSNKKDIEIIEKAKLVALGLKAIEKVEVKIDEEYLSSPAGKFWKKVSEATGKPIKDLVERYANTSSRSMRELMIYLGKIEIMKKWCEERFLNPLYERTSEEEKKDV